MTDRTEHRLAEAADDLTDADDDDGQTHAHVRGDDHERERDREPHVHQRQRLHPVASAHPPERGDLGDHHARCAEHEQHADRGLADAEAGRVGRHEREQEPEAERDGDVGDEQPEVEPVGEHLEEPVTVGQLLAVGDSTRWHAGQDGEEHEVRQHVHPEQDLERAQAVVVHEQAAEHPAECSAEVECCSLERRHGWSFVRLHDQRQQGRLGREPHRVADAEQDGRAECRGERVDHGIRRAGDDRDEAADREDATCTEPIAQRAGEGGADDEREAHRPDREAGAVERDTADLVEVDEREPEQRRRADGVDDRGDEEPLQRRVERTEPGRRHEGSGYGPRFVPPQRFVLRPSRQPAATQRLASVPITAAPLSINSPSFKKRPRAAPTPSGVPVNTMSPGARVQMLDRYDTR